VDMASLPASTGAGSGLGEDELIAVARRVAELEHTVNQLQDQMRDLREQLGLSQPGQS
jgi:uncharacterized protein